MNSLMLLYSNIIFMKTSSPSNPKDDGKRYKILVIERKEKDG
jgi:hypothetical protein